MLDDLEHELQLDHEASQRVWAMAHVVEASATQARELARELAVARRSGTPFRVTGRALALALSELSRDALYVVVEDEPRRRYERSLVRWNQHAFVVFLLVEDTLRRRLVPVFHPARASMIAALEDEPHAARALAAWWPQSAPAERVTLGAIKLMLVACHRALTACPDHPIGRALRAAFGAHYPSLATGPSLARCIDRVVQIRNAVVHGHATDDAKPTVYPELCQRLVGASDFAFWEENGPATTPPSPDHAILHHHLAPMENP